ncbi:hypothetical protein HYFRA_00001377 [Hymenoscyphus fraxineus]|uniref:aminodeoxychorismate synthase n=1 Tax=Hymenoscyphus fraxineus TaxID=746836 RepID=A0A9N9PMC7_9HELO|nr:hypothetical protein HYFRA_00001377 [Hymenoscyphus fraxineus]
MLVSKPLILFIDAYDSFSNNIISLLETTLDASVRTVKIDSPAFETDDDLYDELRNYAAVVCGPGPGHPAIEKDIGLVKRIWRLSDEHTLPVLGICLGFQSLCLEFGGRIERLKGPQHGITRDITHIGGSGSASGESIFAGVERVQATLYQSLCADIGQASISDAEWSVRKWDPSPSCPELFPLAWVESDLSKDSDCGVKDARVLVAVRHARKPFWALQYHPESICTNEESKKVVQNWWKVVQSWNKSHERKAKCLNLSLQGQCSTRESLLHQAESFRHLLNGSASFPFQKQEDGLITDSEQSVYHSREFHLDGPVSVPSLVEAVTDTRRDQIILESSNAYEATVGSADVRGRYSIIALEVDDCVRFEYTAHSHEISAIYPKKTYAARGSIRRTDLRRFGGVWPFLAQYLEKRALSYPGSHLSPFLGGFMGYTTYELGLECIGVIPERRTQHLKRPDLAFAWVSRSLVIDHVENMVYLQVLTPTHQVMENDKWMDEMESKLKPFIFPSQFSDGHASSKTANEMPAHKQAFASITLPKDEEYESKVRSCQEFIRSGNSYELCLTDQTSVTRPRSARSANSDWRLYKTLRSRQPAPFASYVRLGPATLISGSPERFLKWHKAGKCELRPMKGTVRKSDAVNTLAAATALLDVPKEKAENLMIVDLVRHDLHGVCGSGNVQVPRLMVVEEYKSVFQMISVVEGQIPPSFESEKKTRYTGIDVLAASLPPGSMTGAPKKRSCEILQEIEGSQERSMYSGVVGYMDVGGNGDWSVTIRSMFRWDDEQDMDVAEPLETWHIGAGGAITTLSTPAAEREEMQTKLNGTLGLFR